MVCIIMWYDFLECKCSIHALMCYSAGAVAVSEETLFSDDSRGVFLTSPNCLGNESSLVDCSQRPCSAQIDVGVVCQGIILMLGSVLMLGRVSRYNYFVAMFWALIRLAAI